MPHPGINAPGPETLQNLKEGGELGLRRAVLGEGAVEVGVDAPDPEALHAVDGGGAIQVLRQEAVAAHAGVDLEVDLRHGGALGGDGVQHQGGLQGAHREDEPQVQHGVDLLRVLGLPEHEDGGVGEARLPQGARLPQLGDAEALDAVGRQGPGHGHGAQAVAAALEHGPDGGVPCLLQELFDILRQQLLFYDISFHAVPPEPSGWEGVPLTWSVFLSRWRRR